MQLVYLQTIDENRYQSWYAQAPEDRRLRADRFARREDAVRCIAADALLRDALREVGVDPSTAVHRGENGKPYVNVPDFYYSISHGGDIVMVAYAATEIGADVEPITVSDSRIAVARRHFTTQEQKAIFSGETTHEELARRFTIVWTRKESYVKYTGIGLTGGLRSFSVDTLMPCGGVESMTGERLPLRCHTEITKDHHCISVCGAFDTVRAKIIV